MHPAVQGAAGRCRQNVARRRTDVVAKLKAHRNLAIEPDLDSATPAEDRKHLCGRGQSHQSGTWVGSMFRTGPHDQPSAATRAEEWPQPAPAPREVIDKVVCEQVLLRRQRRSLPAGLYHGGAAVEQVTNLSGHVLVGIPAEECAAREAVFEAGFGLGGALLDGQATDQGETAQTSELHHSRPVAPLGVGAAGRTQQERQRAG